jgi:hypothetical protein
MKKKDALGVLFVLLLLFSSNHFLYDLGEVLYGV